MKIQKIFVEVYADDDIDISEWIKDELIENDRVSYRNVHLISEEDTPVSFPEQYEEDIHTILGQLHEFMGQNGVKKSGLDLIPLHDALIGLRSLLK